MALVLVVPLAWEAAVALWASFPSVAETPCRTGFGCGVCAASLAVVACLAVAFAGVAGEVGACPPVARVTLVRAPVNVLNLNSYLPLHNS